MSKTSLDRWLCENARRSSCSKTPLMRRARKNSARIVKETPVLRSVVIGLTAVLAGTVVLAAPAQAAAPKTSTRVVAVAGSDGYLVYETARASKDIQPGDRNHGTLAVRDRNGRVTGLPHFADGVGVIRQTGHSLVERTNTNEVVDGVTYGVEQVRHRDLTTGKETVVTLAPDESLASVAPDGYLVRRNLGGGDGGSDAGTTTLTDRHDDGSTSTIAVPFTDGTDYTLQAGDQTLIATTPSSDEQTRPSRIAWMAWTDPGIWHPLYNAGQPRDISCAIPSSTHVACRVDGIDEAGPGLVLFRLADRHATWLSRTHPKTCALVDWTTRAANLYALERSDAGSCTKGTLYRLQDDGRLINGSDRYRYSTLGGITTAYRTTVLSSGDQRRLLTTTGVTKKPTTLVRP